MGNKADNGCTSRFQNLAEAIFPFKEAVSSTFLTLPMSVHIGFPILGKFNFYFQLTSWKWMIEQKAGFNNLARPYQPLTRDNYDCCPKTARYILRACETC